MALTDENGGMNTTMLVSPTSGYQNGGLGSCFGGDSWWILLLFILLGNGGFGFGGFGGFGNMGMIGSEMYPWMNQANLTNSGFQNQMLNDNVTSIRDGISSIGTQLCGGFGNVQNSLCSGFAGVNATINSGFANAETAANSRQMANMQQAFTSQTAMTQGLNAVNTGIGDLRYTVATEACADRAAVGDALQNVTMQNMGNTNVIVSAIRDGVQSIKDDLCADRLAASQREVDAERRENANLRTQLNMANLAASQTAQNAFISQGFANEVDQLYNRLKSCPVGTTPVYGNQPIFTCPNNGYNGCGCNG